MRENITYEDFHFWQKSNWVVFASEIIHGKKYLAFMVNMQGDIKVVFGGDLLYKGKDFHRASLIYNEFEEIKL